MTQAAPSSSALGARRSATARDLGRGVRHRDAEPGVVEHLDVVPVVADGEDRLARNAEHVRDARERDALVGFGVIDLGEQRVAGGHGERLAELGAQLDDQRLRPIGVGDERDVARLVGQRRQDVRHEAREVVTSVVRKWRIVRTRARTASNRRTMRERQARAPGRPRRFGERPGTTPRAVCRCRRVSGSAITAPP